MKVCVKRVEAKGSREGWEKGFECQNEALQTTIDNDYIKII